MSNLEEAYSQITISDNFTDSFDNDIDAELFRMLHDRETIYNNVHMNQLLCQETNPVVDQKDVDSILKEYKMDSYIGECSKYKQSLMDILHEISIANADYSDSQANVDLLNDICDNIKRKFSNESHALEATNNVLLKYKEMNKIHYETLCNFKKKLYILHKFSPHYINNDPRKLCSICVQREVEIANVPCGHTLCTECSNKIVSRECFFCRTEIEKVIKLYFT